MPGVVSGAGMRSAPVGLRLISGMIMKKTALVSLHLLGLFWVSFSANANDEQYPTNRGELIGPTLRMGANANGFVVQTPAPGGDLEASKGLTYCAPANSSLTVTKRKDEFTWVEFKALGALDKDDKEQLEAYALICGEPPRRVHEDIVYRISNDQFDAIPLRSSGVAYGALVVPFKFRLGSDKKISSSATIAPYIGARWHRLQKWGVEMTPIATAGLALVPVNDPDTNDSSTKAAFSTALGLTLTSTTQKSFSAGLLIGRDFLGKRDRALDPSLNKLWVSIWFGTAQ